MKKYTDLELKNILDKHFLWLAGDPNGVRADLSGADLSEANLNRTNLREADLRGADLRKADLRWTDLSGADLRKADLSEANLYMANFSEANLRVAYLRGADLSCNILRKADLSGADLSGANLNRTNLRWADLSEANLSEANLSEANLSDANLREADLSEADLSEANLYRANLCGAYLHRSKGINYPMNCPEKGSFIGFKKVRGYLIVELEITGDALRSSAAGKKCRCSKAKVLSITNIDGTESNTNSARSLWDPDFVYTVGETIEVPNFDTNRWNECAPGIHFFITRQEAVDFIM